MSASDEPSRAALWRRVLGLDESPRELEFDNEIVMGSRFASDQPREDLLIRGIPAKASEVVRGVLAEVARPQRAIVASVTEDFCIQEAAAYIIEAMRLAREGK